MKKILLVLFFFLTILSLHSQSNRNNNIDFGLTCLIAVSNDTAVPAPGISAAWYNTNLFGLFGFGTYLNVVMPIMAFDDGDEKEYVTGIVGSFLAGPNYMIYNNGVVAFPVTLGFHFDFISTANNIKINLGIGTVIDFIYKFNEKWHAYARVLAVYNFGSGGEFLAFPGIGAGFSF